VNSRSTTRDENGGKDIPQISGAGCLISLQILAVRRLQTGIALGRTFGVRHALLPLSFGAVSAEVGFFAKIKAAAERAALQKKTTCQNWGKSWNGGILTPLPIRDELCAGSRHG
jgi:hypothetical protein